MPGLDKTYTVTADEAARLAALEAYNILDTPPEEDLDRLVRLAARIFDVPISLVTLIADDRLYFKAGVGLGVTEIARDISFCTHVIDSGLAQPLVIPDTLLDTRYASSPLVVGDPHLRFYAAVPLIDPDGYFLGTFCIGDRKPRAAGMSEQDCRILADLAALAMDRMELRRLAAASLDSRLHFQRIAATSPDGIVCLSADGIVTFWSPAAERIFGYGAAQMLDQPFATLVAAGAREDFRSGIARLAASGGVLPVGQAMTLPGLRQDGTRFTLEMSFSMWQEAGVPAFGAIVRDVTEQKLSEERLFRMARVDSLTELANRETFNLALDDLFAGQTPFALLLLDLDGFKHVNDTLGHIAGDAVLKTMAHRLRLVFSGATTVARLGGDEFAVLIEEADFSALRAHCRRALQALADPMELDNVRIEVGASMGVAVCPMHGNSQSLLANADLALYEAKKHDRNVYRFFVPDLREAVMQRKKIEAELRSAYTHGQLEVHFQPQISLRTNQVVGAEALLRWHHPVRGLLHPGEFIHVLETSPSVVRVGAWILASACRYAAAWRREALPDFRIAVNLFPAQVHSPHLEELVHEALAASGLPAEGLELEITENTVLKPGQHPGNALKSLRDAGVKIAFDDYGTGFASLSLLKRMPITGLKIDRSFIANLPEDTENAALVQAILYLARQFHLHVVAEGVETRAQEAFLRRHGCDDVQGYLYGEALNAEDFRRRYLATPA